MTEQVVSQPVMPQQLTPQPVARATLVAPPQDDTDPDVTAFAPPVPTMPYIPAPAVLHVRAGKPASQRPADEPDAHQLEQVVAQLVPAALVPLSAPPPAPPSVAAPAETALRERLIETVQQLMVGHVPGAGPQVRMVLHESVLAGTTVVVQQVAAQLQVSFECSAQASRQRLERTAPAFAQALARRLGRDVEVLVRDENGDALEPVHARADAREVSQ